MSPVRVTAKRSAILSGLFAHRPNRGMRSPSQHRLMVAAAGLMLLMLTLLVPALAVGAQSGYPPNIVVSTYFDARYGDVAVVSDASGNLIDINAATGQRIYPVYADYTAAYTNAYVAPAYTNATVAPIYTSAATYAYANQAAFNGSAVYRQYTDSNSNCVNGQVTQTASGYYCTATGTPAISVG